MIPDFDYIHPAIILCKLYDKNNTTIKRKSTVLNWRLPAELKKAHLITDGTYR